MKSDVSDYLELLHCIYRDACSQCSADVSMRDLKTIRSRVEHEGISFLTITLPDFCKAVEAAVENGGIETSWRGTSFRRFKFQGGGPAFLQGLLSQVFDYETGRIWDYEDVSSRDRISRCLDSIRQICLIFKKLQLPCTPERDARAANAFSQIERELSAYSVPKTETANFLAVSDMLWGNCFSGITGDEITPRHGPGTTAEGITGNTKFSHQTWYDRLDNYFPILEYGYVLSAMSSKEFKDVSIVPEADELPVKVVFVPKTLKAPRVIAIEPVCMQYAQQAVRGMIYNRLENFWITRDHLNFSDQTVNQRLAIQSSDDGRLATIDLSDASDRVPRDLALAMFRCHPDLLGAIDACRSKSAKLPNGTVLSPLVKFASMGSALCFPIESMYFYTICVAALLEFHSLPVSLKNIYFVSRDIYVYGDDIIVPSYAAEDVLDWLRKYNCRPNVHKTFYRGPFRESCGADAVFGRLVTPVYLRRVVPRRRKQAAEIVSWSATANLLYKKGYWRSAEFLHTHVESILRVYPSVSEESSAVGRIYPTSSSSAVYRCNRKLQRREVKAWVVGPKWSIDHLEGYAALTKCLLRLPNKETPSTLLAWAKGDFSFPIDPKHLERSAMRGACTLQLRWVAAP